MNLIYIDLSVSAKMFQNFSEYFSSKYFLEKRL